MASFVVEMGMKAKTNIPESIDITPLISPIAYSLHSSCLSTHCYGCFCLINKDITRPVEYPRVRYCSNKCAELDSLIYFSSGEDELLSFLESNTNSWPVNYYTYLDNAYLRLALRLLYILPPDTRFPEFNATLSRFHGLCWIQESEYTPFVEDAAMLIATALSATKRRKADRHDPLYMRFFILAMINSLPVSFDPDSSAVGIALYDYRISWVNHSCTPNSRLSFVPGFPKAEFDGEDMLITHFAYRGDLGRLKVTDFSTDPLGEKYKNRGPQVSIKTIEALKEGEEVTICYIDLSNPMMKALRMEYLSEIYQFRCECSLCEAETGALYAAANSVGE